MHIEYVYTPVVHTCAKTHDVVNAFLFSIVS